MVLAFTFLSFTSTLLPQRTIGMFSQTRTKSPKINISFSLWIISQASRLTVPVGDILISNARCNIKHDDTALSINVVAVAKTAKLLLPSGIPHIKLNFAQVLFTISLYTLSASAKPWATHSGEAKRVNLNTKRCDVFLLKLAGQMALDEGGLLYPLSALSNQLSASSQWLRNTATARKAIIETGFRIVRHLLTFPVPPSPTSTSLKVGTLSEAAILLVMI
jgi:hypothetical protein